MNWNERHNVGGIWRKTKTRAQFTSPLFPTFARRIDTCGRLESACALVVAARASHLLGPACILVNVCGQTARLVVEGVYPEVFSVIACYDFSNH